MADTRLGIIGAGKLGTTLARAAVESGYNITLAGSGDVKRLALTARFLAPGARPASTSEVVGEVDTIVLAVPTNRFRELDHRLFDGHVLVDAMNYWEPVDGFDAELVSKPSSSSLVVQRWFPGAYVVKSLNQLGYHDFEELRRPAEAPDRLAMAAASDWPQATETVLDIIDRLGFDPVNAGDLRRGAMLGPGGPAFGTALRAAALQRLVDLELSAGSADV